MRNAIRTPAAPSAHSQETAASARPARAHPYPEPSISTSGGAPQPFPGHRMKHGSGEYSTSARERAACPPDDRPPPHDEPQLPGHPASRPLDDRTHKV